MKLTIKKKKKTVEILEEVTVKDLYDYLTTLNCLDYKIKLSKYENSFIDFTEKFNKTINNGKNPYTVTYSHE